MYIYPHSTYITVCIKHNLSLVYRICYDQWNGHKNIQKDSDVDGLTGLAFIDYDSVWAANTTQATVHACTGEKTDSLRMFLQIEIMILMMMS